MVCDFDSLGPLFGFAGFLYDFRGIYHPVGFDSILGAFLGVYVKKKTIRTFTAGMAIHQTYKYKL